MASKTVTISSDYDLEGDIAKFLKKTGLTRAEFHRRSSVFFIASEERKNRGGM